MRHVSKEYVASVELWCWRSMGKISWTDLVRMKKYYKELRKRGLSYIQ